MADYYTIYKRDQLDMPKWVNNAIDESVYAFLIKECEIVDNRVFDDPFDNACRGFKVEIIEALDMKINYKIMKNGEAFVLIREKAFDVQNDNEIPTVELEIVDVLNSAQVDYLDRSIEKLFRTPRVK